MIGELLAKTIKEVTAPYAKQRKREERGRPEVRARRSRILRSDYEYSDRVTIKDVGYACMEDAYMKASANGTLPTHARQIFYAARPTILEKAHDRYGNPLDLKSDYFTQTLLPDYMNENPIQTADWDVVFDARGKFTEPHTGNAVPLGTVDVREYLHEMTNDGGKDVSFQEVDETFPTAGPVNRYGAIVFIEKEGFLPLFKKVRLAERYDIAIMSTKGMSVTAARNLVEKVCGTYSVPLLILRDFDKAGFAIAASFQKDTRRYQFTQSFEVVDLGLRLEDVQRWNLVSEDVHYTANPTRNLVMNGASPDERAFLLEGGSRKKYYGRRVELNAFPSSDFIQWIESKLDSQGIKKIIPDKDVLENAYARAVKVAVVNNAIEAALDDAEDAAQKLTMPKMLKQKIAERLQEDPTLTWDSVLAHFAAANMVTK